MSFIATLTLTLSSNPSVGSAIDYTTVNGTAIAGIDYTTTTGTLTFNGNENIKLINVPILNPHISENAKAFTLSLSNFRGISLSTQNTVSINSN